MNRNEFILELNTLLSDLSENERKEAVSYYEDYFYDAGPEAEQEVIQSLGSPEKVAANIKAGLNGSDKGEFSERGYCTENDRKKEEVMSRGVAAEEKKYSKKRDISISKIILIVIACIILIPILSPFALGLGTVLIGLIVAAASIIFGIFVIGVVLAVVGIVAFIVGVIQLFLLPALGISIIGVAMVLAGIGSLLAVLGIWIISKLLPPIVRGIVNGCRKLLGCNN